MSYSFSALVCLAFAYLLRPNEREVRLLCAAYASGVLLSCVVAIGQDVPGSLRPTGLTTHPNHLGISALLGSAVWLALALSETRWWIRIASGLGFLITMFGVLESGSRASLVGMAAAVVFALVGVRTKKRTVLWVGGLSVGAAVFLLGYIRIGSDNAVTRLLGQGSAQAADEGRSIRYAVVEQRIRDHPFLGNGFGDSRFGHSLYLQMWSIAGLLGLVAVVILVASTVHAWRLARRRNGRLAVALWSAYGGYLVAAILSNQMWDRYLWLVLALALLADRLDHDRARGGALSRTASSFDHGRTTTSATRGGTQLLPSPNLQQDHHNKSARDTQQGTRQSQRETSGRD